MNEKDSPLDSENVVFLTMLDAKFEASLKRAERFRKLGMALYWAGAQWSMPLLLPEDRGESQDGVY